MRRFIGSVLIWLAVSGASAAASEPGSSAWAANEQARVRLVAAATGVGESGRARLGLEFALAPGWKTYWRTPGEAGFAMRVDWSGSANLAEATIAWPAPTRFTLFGLDTFGYGERVIFPVAVRIADPTRPARLQARIEYLVCEQVCIPHDARLALDLELGAGAPTAFAHEIDRFRALVPRDGLSAGLAIERAAWRGGASPALLVEVAALDRLARTELLVEGAPGWSFGAPRLRLGADGLSGRLEAPARADFPDARPPTGAPLTLTAIDGMRATEARIVVAPAPADSGDGPATLAAAIALALLGGLILNLMPCVLPVLALKVMGLVGASGAPPARARLGFLASAAGIVAAFLALGGALAALAAAGRGVGWGIQFQSPVFLGAMALLLAAFAANLWGWFTIPLPGFASALAARPVGDGPAGSFFAGALATLLATPCSAPFLGTAIGFALAGGTGETLAVFAALGLGMALPYLAVAAVPGIARALPRPGPWMARLRVGLGGLLLGTALWLGSLVVVSERGAAAPASAVAWQPWSRAALDRALGEGKVVFVDVTADWCITCRVNKALALGRDDVVAALNAPGVVALQADWTRPDPRIADYLAGFGRYGIPFDAVYGPGRPGGEALPELLTAESVRAALARARNP